MNKFPAIGCWFMPGCGWVLLLCVGLLAGGCQTQPPPSNATGLSEEQVIALRELGFEVEQGGWGLNFDGLLLFGSDASKLSVQNRETIARMVKVLNVIGIERLRVEGYADDRGSKIYNEKLSLRRAEVVAREIERNGVPYRNITVVGFGTDNPVGDNKTRKGRAQNRRVVVIVPVED